MRLKHKRGEIVSVKTVGLYPNIKGLYQIKRMSRFSNYPYRIEHKGERVLLDAREVHSVGRLDENTAKDSNDY